MAAKCKVTRLSKAFHSRRNSVQKTGKNSPEPHRKSPHTCSFTESVYKILTLRSGGFFGGEQEERTPDLELTKCETN